MQQVVFARLWRGIVSLALLIPALALANQEVITVNLEPQPLDQAVLKFAEQTGLMIGGDSALLEGKSAPAVNGDYTAAQALDKLLVGSDVSYHFTKDNTVQLIAAPTTNDVLSALPPVTVRAGGIAEGQRSTSYDLTQLSELRPRDLKDVFRQDSAISVGGSIPLNEKVYVRGIEETAMSVTVDGARQNNRVFHHNTTNLIDPALLKAVRASAGISPADDGPGAIGGSIVYETVGVADLLQPGEKFGAFVDGGFESNGEALKASGSLFGRSETSERQGFEYLAFLNNTSGDNYESGSGDEVRFTEPALSSGLAKLAYQTEAIGRFELSHETVNDDAARPYRANFIGLSAGRPVPESRNYDLTRANTILQYSHQKGSGYWNPSVVIGDNQTKLVTTEHPLDAPASPVVYTGVTDSFSVKLQNAFTSRFGEINTGLDYYDDQAVFRYAGDPDLEESADNLGAFVQVRRSFSDTVELSYGARYDAQNFTGTDGSQLDESGVSGNLFVEYHLNEYISLNAGYADVWGGIALAENYILNPEWDYSGGIQPVTSSNYTAGLQGRFERIIVEANQYRTKISNGRTPSYGDGPGVVADFDVDGYDVTLGYFSDAAELTIKYSNIDTDKDGVPATSYDGNYFTAPLGELITLSAALDLSDWQLRLGLNSETTLDNDTLQSSGNTLEGYTVVNLYADYQALQNLSLRASIDNVTDEEYADRASYGQEYETVQPFLEPGRSFGISARYEF